MGMAGGKEKMSQRQKTAKWERSDSEEQGVLPAPPSLSSVISIVLSEVPTVTCLNICTGQSSMAFT